MASITKSITKALENSSGGQVRATHQRIMAELKLSGCNRVKLDGALAALEESGKVKVEKTATHTTITAC